ncbi:MAG TPA: PfkB family carbohydrate kinase [Elusimicrobiales bacterium]|nr:PfkB family carbohydrate kinase [Elusimicrobiales bacterium]
MKIIVFGGCNFDITARPLAAVRACTSVESRVNFSAGGVGANIAANLARFGCRPTLVTPLGEDQWGVYLRANLRRAGVAARIIPAARTGIYVAALQPDGGLLTGFCDMLAEKVTPRDIDRLNLKLKKFDAAVIDANFSAATISHIAGLCRQAGLRYALEPVSDAKSLRLKGALRGCEFIKPNMSEAGLLAGQDCSTAARARRCARLLAARGAKNVVVSLGSGGIHVLAPGSEARFRTAKVRAANVTGAGDALFAAFYFGLLKGFSPRRCARAGLAAAALTCGSAASVSSAVTAAIFDGDL